jgi:cytochrome c-type biogenesis protein CcmH
LLVGFLAMIACRSSDDPAHEIERRVLAPCCYRQTLAEHESDLARTLRLEVRQRVARGESSTVIEDDLARRYGEEIRAMPRGWDPRTLLAAIIAIALALGGLVLRWVVAARPDARAAAQEPAASPGADLAYEAQLDDELVDID